MAFSDATVEASADFAKFDREFPTKLRASVAKATRVVVSEFNRAGGEAGRAFADAVSDQFGRITTAARTSGAEAGRAFASAAQQFTENIDVGFKLAAADGTRLGQQFRAAAERATRRIPVSFAVTPSARAVGRVTGQRFRAGAMEFTKDIPVSFDTAAAGVAGGIAGARFKTAAERASRGIKPDVDSSGIRRTDSEARGLFRTIAKFSGLTLFSKVISGVLVFTKAIVAARLALLALGALMSALPVAAFVGNLLPLTGLLTLIPGAILTAAAAFIVLGVSFERLGQVIKSNLVPAFSGLRDQIARTVTADLPARLQRVGKVLAGPVRDGALAVASSFNKLLKQVTDFLSTAQTASATRVLFASAATAVSGLADAIKVLLPGIRDLAVAVSPVFDQFVLDINAGIQALGGFLTRSAQGGQAFKWAQAAREVLGELIGIVVNLGSIVVTIFSTASQVGGNLLARVNELLGRFDLFLRSAQGAEILTTIFTTLNQISAALAPVLFAVLSFLGKLVAAALPGFLPLINVISELAVILINTLQPVLAALTPVFASLRGAIAAVLAVLGPILGQVGSVLANILSELGVVLGGILSQLGPVLADLVTALGGALVPVLLTLEPIIGILLKALEPLFPVIAQLIPPITELVVALTPLLVVLANLTVVLVQILVPFIKFFAEGSRFQLIEVLVPLIDDLARALTAVLTPLLGLLGPLDDFGNSVEGFDLTGFVKDLGQGFANALKVVGDFFVKAGDFFAALPGKILDFLSSLPRRLAQAFQDAFFAALEAIAFGITSIVVFFIQLGQRIAENLLALARIVGDFFVRIWNDPIGTTKAAVDAIVNFVVGIGERITGFLTGLVISIGNFFTNAWKGAVDATVAGVNNIVNFVKSIPDRIVAFGSRMFEVGKFLINRLGEGLSNLATIAGDFGQRIIDRIKAFINSAINAIERGINRATSKIGINIDLPGLASGAVLTSPTVAVLAERGPEVVIPLSNPARARQLVDESGLSSVVNLDKQATTNVRVFIGQRELTEIIRVETDQAIGAQAEILTNGPRFVGA